MDNQYGICDIILWSVTGYFAGEFTSQIILAIMNGNRGPPDRVTKIALAYGMIGLIGGFVRGYTKKSVIELIVS
jgi:hypothetical protein